MNAFPANFKFIPHEEYAREQYNLEARISVDELEDEQFLKVYGLFPEASKDHGSYNALVFNAKVELTPEDRDSLKHMGNAALQFLIYPDVITDETEPAYAWSAVGVPDLRPDAPLKNGSPLVDWAFLSEKPVIFENGLKLRMGFLSHLMLDTYDHAAIEQYVNQKEQ